MTSFDVAVVGGGPGGCAAALTFASASCSVVIIDAPAPRLCGVETIPPGAKPLLRDLRCWPDLDIAGCVPAYANESAWGGEGVQRNDFTCDPNGHGWHVDRVRFDAHMRTVATACGAVLVADVAESIDRCDRSWQIATADGQRLSASWIIDASGRRADIGRALGARRVAADSLIAVMTRVRRRDGTRDRDRVTFVEAVSDGWWYTAADADGRRVMAYFTDAAHESARQARSDAGFIALWNATAHLQTHVAPADHLFVEAPGIRPASTTRLSRVGGEGWLAVGDAVATFDPISSQGILTAAYTGLRAAECVLRARAHGHRVAGDYQQFIDRVYDAHLAQRLSCYASERRWADTPFWRARHAGIVASRRSAATLDHPRYEHVEM